MRRLNIQLTEEQYEALRILAFHERRSIADVVREAIKRYLERGRPAKDGNDTGDR